MIIIVILYIVDMTGIKNMLGLRTKD